MISILICDDSLMARKQIARCLPQDLEADVYFAKHGEEALKLLREDKGDLLLLDLNMPVMDGYQTLEEINKRRLQTKVVVISGDIQEQAHQRVMQLGVVDFIEKPVTTEMLTHVLQKHRLTDETSFQKSADAGSALPEAVRDCLQEMANVAMGRAGKHLADLLNVFVELPVPNVNLIETNELSMVLSAIDQRDATTGICQGFLADGVAGEALCVLSDASFEDVAKIMGIDRFLDDELQLEILMDLASLLIGNNLAGIGEQLDLNFRQAQPVVLGQHQAVEQLLRVRRADNDWRQTLAIEFSYGIEGFAVCCDILFLFTKESLPVLTSKLAYLMEDDE